MARKIRKRNRSSISTSSGSGRRTKLGLIDGAADGEGSDSDESATESGDDETGNGSPAANRTNARAPSSATSGNSIDATQ
jgi:hypothetical protein